MPRQANVSAVVTVREATEADVDAVGAVHAETWRATYTGVFPESAFDPAGRRRFWQSYFDERWPGVALFVAEHRGGVVGFANLGRCRDEEGVGELFAIYVHPRSWGTGAGRALIERGDAFLRESGFDQAVLWVLEGNERAERFYRAAGWSRDGGRKVEEFQGAELTEVRYRKPL
jgi:RimJ/RimL family protein N-acetyltransferase